MNNECDRKSLKRVNNECDRDPIHCPFLHNTHVNQVPASARPGGRAMNCPTTSRVSPNPSCSTMTALGFLKRVMYPETNPAECLG